MIKLTIVQPFPTQPRERFRRAATVRSLEIELDQVVDVSSRGAEQPRHFSFHRSGLGRTRDVSMVGVRECAAVTVFQFRLRADDNLHTP